MSSRENHSEYCHLEVGNLVTVRVDGYDGEAADPRFQVILERNPQVNTIVRDLGTEYLDSKDNYSSNAMRLIILT